MSSRPQSVFVCYVPGLDARRIDAHNAPYIDSLRCTYPVVGIRTLPNTELIPTLVTGTLPHQHKVWQVSLKPEYKHGVPRDLPEWLPDILVTTLQGARHFVDRTYDLAMIPWRRRRRFDLHRFKYTRRASTDDAMDDFSGYRSIFGLLGDQAQYIFTKDFATLPELAQRYPSGRKKLEFLEMYALDLTQHWHLDNDAAMHDAVKQSDDFVRAVHARCRQMNVQFVLLIDHGQERVVGTVPLIQAVQRAGIPETEYSYFVELASARFWFHTERARRAITAAIESLPHSTLLTWREMHQHQVCFDDDAFGELYVFADAGWIFFPHDFYQPLGNAVLGLMDRHQRQRFRNPIHRGNHGYLPHHASEQGWLLTDSVKPVTRTQAHLVDIAPSLLDLVDVAPPDYMKGASLFR